AHGFTSKKDILEFGVDKFVQECKDRVTHFAGIQTEQSIRLGYWMDWDHSYYTNSDENNYTIWGFLKTCWEKGWVSRATTSCRGARAALPASRSTKSSPRATRRSRTPA